MGISQITIFGILGILGNLPGMELCQFGENCDYPCHCQNNDVCDPVDGSCPAGCDDGDLRDPGDLWYTGAWTGYGCQIGNVAYNKSATHGPDPWNYPPERAIDGNHDPDMNRGSCVWPYDDDRRVLPWWQVDLGDTYVVISVRITNRNHDRRLAAFVRITVGTEEDDMSSYRICHVVRGEGAVATNHVTCDVPVVGRFVRLQRFNSRGAWVTYELTICEVQVYGYLHHDCPDGFFGVACGSLCNCRSPCDDTNGVCSGNCSDGWTGDDCQAACSPGWRGDSCQEICNCQGNLEVCTPTDGSCAYGCNTGYGGVGYNLELPGLLSVLELSSASHNTLTIRFNSWTPENGGGAQPRGYLVETRINGSMEWISRRQTDHDSTIAVYTILLKDLEPHAPYYVRVTPYIEDGGNVYYGNASHEAGPFLTLEVEPVDLAIEQMKKSTTSNIVGALLACVIGTILIIVFVIVLRRHRNENRRGDDDSMPTNIAIPEVKGATDNDDHVYESYEEKREALTALNDREYENQTPNLGRMSQRNEGYVEEFTHGPGVSAQLGEEGYETLGPIASGVDTNYEPVRGGTAIVSGADDPIYDN